MHSDTVFNEIVPSPLGVLSVEGETGKGTDCADSRWKCHGVETTAVSEGYPNPSKPVDPKSHGGGV